MTTTSKATDRPRYIVGANVETDVLAPSGLSATPPEVEAAIKDAEKACAGHRLAATQARATAEEVKRAQAIDASADQAAIAAGKPMPTKRATPVAVEAAALARRRMDAAQEHARSRIVQYAIAVDAHRHAWLAEITGVISAQQAEARRLLDELTHVLDELAAEKWARSTLASFPPHGALTGIRFRPGELADRINAAVREENLAKLQQTREVEGASRFMDPSYDSIVAAMRALISADETQR